MNCEKWIIKRIKNCRHSIYGCDGVALRIEDWPDGTEIEIEAEESNRCNRGSISLLRIKHKGGRSRATVCEYGIENNIIWDTIDEELFVI